MDANIENIRKLIEAFYNADTTSEEEKFLHDYFTGGQVAEEFLAEKKFFVQLYRDYPPANIPVKMESDINELIDTLEMERKSKLVSFRKKMWITLGGIAAAFILIISIVEYYIDHKSDNPIAGIAYTDEEMCKIEQAQEALIMVSLNLNKGLEQLEVATTKWEQSNKILKKVFK